ncbi:MAG: hypothetical protein GQ557_02285 [Mycoplasmataceae bacterium]|nr:hypothetical protein [Mycoplasmataceae bacterium]
MKEALIYLHGFNSASIDNHGNLLSKNKLKILNNFCNENNFKFIAPNLDYRNIPEVIENLNFLERELDKDGYDVTFIGTSLGGFFAEYMAWETLTKAILINPAINPSKTLKRYIGNIKNFANGKEYKWTSENCEAFVEYEQELLKFPYTEIPRTVILDRGDEVIDVERTIERYDGKASVHTFEGGSHRFDHIEEALPIIKKAIFSFALPLTD